MSENIYDAMAALCRESLETFASRAFRVIEPGTPYEWAWHIECICEHLEASFRGELPWLLISMPPRVLKSTLIAQIYPAWVMGKEPEHQFIGASYAHSLAERNVIKARQIIEDDWYMDLFPATRISKDQNQKDYFTTTMNGQYKGTGIGGTLTGFGCRTLLLDDGINPNEAASDTIRNSTNTEIRSTLFSRFNDRREARFIGVAQRTNEDDPTGNLLRDRDGRFYHLKLPAEAKHPVKIVLNNKSWEMKEGDLLTPRLSRKDLDELRSDMSEYNFLAQYLQEPVPAGGGEFKDDWVNYYADGSIKPKTMNICILCDPSSGEAINKKKQKTGDYTAFVVVGLAPDNNYYLLDIVRDRLNPTERVEMLFVLHRKWNDLSGKPPKVGYEKYGMQSDMHYIKEKRKQDSYNFSLVELAGKASKESRIRRLIPDMQQGRWWFPANLMYVDNEGRSIDLVRDLIYSEMLSFPRSRYDDVLDCLARTTDETLNMVFPRQQISKTKRMIQDAYPAKEDNWQDW